MRSCFNDEPSGSFFVQIPCVGRLRVPGLIAMVVMFSATVVRGDVPVQLKLSGDWKVEAVLPAEESRPELSATLDVPVAPVVSVVNEEHKGFPEYNPNTAGYARGAKLQGVRNQELTTRFLLVPESLVVRAGPEESSAAFVLGKDYDVEMSWGTIGRLPGGAIREGQPVYVSYRHGLSRLDSVVLTADRKIVYREGAPATCINLPPAIADGEKRLANIWIPGLITRLTEDNLFPILETAYPEPARVSPSIAEQQIPKAMAKIRAGEPLRILAWGDSVTEATYLRDYAKTRWQVQFVEKLRKRFPNAKIELVTEAWGGRNTSSYLGVPPGELHNYQETVLGAKPDLVISEFVNDAGLPAAVAEKNYSKILNDFQAIGAEWIILTPHYVRPDWMGLTRERDIDDDPRPYVKWIREFAEKHNIAVAEGSLRYGRLWRQGVPYTTLMTNVINHPNPSGMTLFADALMELFPEK